MSASVRAGQLQGATGTQRYALLEASSSDIHIAPCPSAFSAMRASAGLVAPARPGRTSRSPAGSGSPQGLGLGSA